MLNVMFYSYMKWDQFMFIYLDYLSDWYPKAMVILNTLSWVQMTICNAECYLLFPYEMGDNSLIYLHNFLTWLVLQCFAYCKYCKLGTNVNV